MLATSDTMRGNIEIDIDEVGGTLTTMTQLVIITSENYVDIPLTNEDDDVELYYDEKIN